MGVSMLQFLIFGTKQMRASTLEDCCEDWVIMFPDHLKECLVYFNNSYYFKWINNVVNVFCLPRTPRKTWIVISGNSPPTRVCTCVRGNDNGKARNTLGRCGAGHRSADRVRREARRLEGWVCGLSVRGKASMSRGPFWQSQAHPTESQQLFIYPQILIS